MSISDHELMLDNFLLTSSVVSYLTILLHYLYCMKEIIESCNSPLRFSFNPNIALRCGSRKIAVQNVFLIGHYLVLPYELTNTLLTDNNESFFIFTTFYSPCTLQKTQRGSFIITYLCTVNKSSTQNAT